jgi:hypothetical protein
MPHPVEQPAGADVDLDRVVKVVQRDGVGAAGVVFDALPPGYRHLESPYELMMLESDASGRGPASSPPSDVLRMTRAAQPESRTWGPALAMSVTTGSRHRRPAATFRGRAVRGKGTLTGMNPPEEITPEHAERLVTLLGMMGDLGREALGFLVGHMASRNIDLAIDAYGALMATELPPDPS